MSGAVPIADIPDISVPLLPAERLIWMETLLEVYHPETRASVPFVANAMQRDIVLTMGGTCLRMKPVE